MLAFSAPRLQRVYASGVVLVLESRRMIKELPKIAEVGALVQMTMNITQTTLFRVYEIIEIERRPLTEEEQRSLDAMLELFSIAENDVQKLKKRMAH
jgi:hypothetical protein